VLEDYLDDFAGAMIVVSHDRYFLDRTVEHLLAFEGDGQIVDYPGAYSYYAEVQAQRAAEAVPAARPQPKASEPAKDARPRKLSFKEQRELGDLESRIAALEAEQATVQAQLNSAASNYQAAQRLALELERLGKALETAFERWSVLAEIAENAG
jgi:ATP-binding cassette subfamily F protein uup